MLAQRSWSVMRHLCRQRSKALGVIFVARVFWVHEPNNVHWGLFAPLEERLPKRS